MPYKNKADRPVKHEYELQKTRPHEHEKRMERQRARRALDKKGVNRTGKDVDHVTPLSKGGTNAPGNLRLTSPSTNRSFSRNPDHTIKRNAPSKK